MVIAFCQHKGGVGKTTTVLNVGAALVRKKKKVLLIDLDPQANLTKLLGVDAEDISIEEALCNGIIPKPQHVHGMDVIGSRMSLAEAEVVTMIGLFARELRLREVLMDFMDIYDFILLDCPPSIGLLTINALATSHYVFIPVEAEYMVTQGMDNMLTVIGNARKRVNTALKFGGIIITKYDARKILNRDVAELIQKNFPGKLMKTRVRMNIALAEAPALGQTIFEYAPKSNGAEDYEALTKDILRAVKVKN